MKYFINNFINPKILHAACHNLSQTDVTKILRPFQAEIIILPMILNTVICILSVFKLELKRKKKN